MFVVTGYHGAGKTEIANSFVKHNFGHIDLGPTLRDIHKQKKPDMSFTDWCNHGESVYGKDFTDIILVENIEKIFEGYNSIEKRPQDMVITGSRSLKGISFIRNNLSSLNGKPFNIIHICVPQEILKNRYCKRECKNLTEKQFEEILKKDKLLGIDTIWGYENYVITNCGTLNDLEEVSKNLLRIMDYRYNNYNDENYIRKKIEFCKDKNEEIDIMLKVDNNSKTVTAEFMKEVGYEASVFNEIPFISTKIEAYEMEEFLNFSDKDKKRYFKKKYCNNGSYIESVEFPSELILRRVHESSNSYLTKV